ncbi:MAG TPA: hypothetical protein VN444_04280, partial [Verrucomicrobiae bacterium]|nr:hypothetical protein [Verrucomicrobiae bacterium]
LVIACLTGFLACYAWQGVKIEALAGNVEAWRQVAETEYRTHHNVVKVNKAQAQVTSTQIEQRKETRP